MAELTHYLTADGYDPFQAWLDATKAKDRQAAMRVLRLNRLAAGNAGDTKTVGGDGGMRATHYLWPWLPRLLRQSRGVLGNVVNRWYQTAPAV